MVKWFPVIKSIERSDSPAYNYEYFYTSLTPIGPISDSLWDAMPRDKVYQPATLKCTVFNA